MLDELRRFAVNLQPRQRVAEDVPVRQRALRAQARAEIAEPPLDSEELAQALDISARQRQRAEPRRTRFLLQSRR